MSSVTTPATHPASSLAASFAPGSDAAPVRLHVVSGKGGAGKTTVAAALALALATEGGRVLLVEVEGRQGIARLFDRAPLPYEETRLEIPGPGDGQLWAQAIDAEQALLEYLELFYKLGRAGKGLRRVGALDFTTTIAPGLRDVLLTGKAYEAVGRRRRDGARTYDAVVMDAPPTGRIGRFLDVHTELAGLARVGPIGGQADKVSSLLRSPETAVHLVTLLEEMPVQETCDAAAELRRLGLPVGAVILNAVRRSLLTDEQLADAAAGRLDRAEVADSLRTAGLDAGGRVVTALLAQAAEHAERVALENEQRAQLAGVGAASYELPQLADGVDPDGLHRLGGLLSQQAARAKAAT